MASRKLKYNGISQEELVACLKDIEAALGGTNSDTAINVSTTYNLAEIELAYTNSISAKISAGSTFSQALSATVAAGTYDGAAMTMLTLMLAYANSYALSVATST